MPPSPGQTEAKMALKVAKMSRIFYASQDKIFSLNFPFFVRQDSSGLTFSTANCPNVDNKVTSNILSLLDSNEVLNHSDFFAFADPIIELYDVDNTAWALFRDLMLCEDGYIRYDHDPARKNGHLHPLHHLDVFYSNSTTFKVGYTEQMSLENMTDILDITTDCHYVSKASAKFLSR